MSHDPYRPKGTANRVYVAAPPDPTNEVPGNEDEAIAWMLAGESGDRAELARRVDLAESVEATRAGRSRSRVVDEIARLRAVITDAEAEWPEPRTDADDTPPAPSAPEVFNEATEPDQDGTGPAADEVPQTAGDVVAWIRAGENAAEQRRRSALAMAVEVERPDGIRATIRAEADKHTPS